MQTHFVEYRVADGPWHQSRVMTESEADDFAQHLQVFYGATLEEYVHERTDPFTPEDAN